MKHICKLTFTLFALLCTVAVTKVFAQTTEHFVFSLLPFPKWWEPANLEVFRKAYPDVNFNSAYDSQKKDWLIQVTVAATPERKAELYWCESRFLPESELKNKNNFRPMLYKYQSKVPAPEDFSAEDIERIKNFTDRDNRKNGAIDPPFLYNVIYDCATQGSTERHIISVPFLTKSVNVHERIAKPLTRVSERIMALERNEELSAFFKTLNRTDGFVWRTVRDTQSRSFHSIGLAVDVLPNGYYQKIIYWSWQKQLRPDDWFMTPVEKRWAPPKEVIQIFAEEGFIWGGTWIVWDNMHFEYRPELLLYAGKNAQ